MQEPLQGLVNKLVDLILNPLIALLFAAGFVVFVWGIVEFMWGLSQDTDHRETGKKHMLWGVIGMFVMASAYAIFLLIKSTVCGLAGGGGGPLCS